MLSERLARTCCSSLTLITATAASSTEQQHTAIITLPHC